MFDIGWGELFLIGVVALIVVGPKELPALFRTVGNFTGKARGMAREFQRSLEQAANEAGMSEVQQEPALARPEPELRHRQRPQVRHASRCAASSTEAVMKPAAPRPAPAARRRPAAARERRAAPRRPRARSARPGDEGRRQGHRRLDGAADRAPGRASHPADQLR